MSGKLKLLIELLMIFSSNMILLKYLSSKIIFAKIWSKRSFLVTNDFSLFRKSLYTVYTKTLKMYVGITLNIILNDLNMRL